METGTVELKEGLTLDGRPQRLATVRESLAGDVLDAEAESDSASAQGLIMLGMQVLNIGDIDGPLTLAEMRKLTNADIERLQDKAEEVDKRGRSWPEGSD